MEVGAAEVVGRDRRDAGAARPRICIIALSAIADDPRVRRQGDAFAAAGWDVVAAGLRGARSAPPDWPILTYPELPTGAPPPPEAAAIEARRDDRDGAPALSSMEPSPVTIDDSLRVRAVRRCYAAYYGLATVRARAMQTAYGCYYRLASARLRAVQRAYAFYYGAKAKRVRALSKFVPGGRLAYACRLIRVRFSPGIAEELYWTLQASIREVAEVAAAADAEIWLANDWNVLPIAARMAKEKGGVYVYDSHEFAAEEYAEKWKWRLWNRPLVRALERQFIRDAAVVSAVSAGIAERLDAMYRLPRPSLVIRNTPFYQRCEFRPTRERIRLLYHGIVVIGRGLEQAIDSVALWRPEYDLTIRGPENPGYSDALRRRIADLGLEDRVRLVPPVPMTALVQEATAFDIGFFVLPGHSRHNDFALPNKFFEYVMAGLALCVSDLPEMARLMAQYRLGVTIDGLDPAAIAAAVNSLSRQQIDICKRNALAAAAELCWERESARLVAAYRDVAAARE